MSVGFTTTQQPEWAPATNPRPISTDAWGRFRALETVVVGGLTIQLASATSDSSLGSPSSGVARYSRCAWPVIDHVAGVDVPATR